MPMATLRFEPMTPRQQAIAVLLMILIVVASNVMVQYPINNWLTWGAVSYPIAFLVADVLNRRFGPQAARRVAYFGFVAALVISAFVATPRIALASGSAFLVAQLCDIYVFDRLRHRTWWQAPFVGGVAGATLDTFVFFSVAFAGTSMPWQTLLLGDLAVKLCLNTFMLAPFRALMWNLANPSNQ
ncbi:VUT family protein [Paenalcaligenes hermetiae]